MRVLLLSLMLLAIPEGENEFIPAHINQAVAVGCMVSGIGDSPPYAETQVFVRMDKSSKTWDFRPVMSRRGDVFKAIEDCREWLEGVKVALSKSQKGVLGDTTQPTNEERGASK